MKTLTLIAFTMVLLSACNSGNPKPPEPTIVRDAIKTLRTVKPDKGSHAIELSEVRNSVSELLKDPTLNTAEKSFASALLQRTQRQLSIEKNLPPSTRIVGGKPADFKKFQYQVALVYSGYDNAFDGQFCGGSLIDPSWVLTAAHCLNDDTQPEDIQVYIGSAKLSMGGQTVSIAASGIFRHVDFNSATEGNDIALLKLASSVQTLQPIPLADTAVEAAMIKHSRIGTVSGWGATKEGGTGSDELLFASVPLVPAKTCHDAYAGLPAERRMEITENMVCAGNQKADSCQGDSGGPLVLRTKDSVVHLEGIVGFGEGCARKKFPGVYTRVPQYAAWIQDCKSGKCKPTPPLSSSVILTHP